MTQSSLASFYLSSTDTNGEWARVRVCWVVRQMKGPFHSQYALVRIEPALVVAQERGGVSDHVVLAPHDVGTTLFPISGFPLAVYVYQINDPRLLKAATLSESDVSLAAWCEIYREREEAERVALTP